MSQEPWHATSKLQVDSGLAHMYTEVRGVQIDEDNSPYIRDLQGMNIILRS